jgi:NADH dehydrogenase [ubiquinone] 1 alpha subcomplex assembly factor 3
MTPGGMQLQDGLLLPGACIFLEGKVFLWDIPHDVTKWTKERFEVFETVVPKPGKAQ